MNRKVVQQGPSTLMVSLPSKWVKENNIHKGDDIEVSEENGRLVLTIHQFLGPVKTELSEKTFGFLNKYFVNYCYQKGYDEVLIKCDCINEIEHRVKDLLGYEVVEKGINSLLIKAVVQMNEQEFDTVLKKLFQVTLVISDLIIKKQFQEAKVMEKENNKYCDLCIRILFKNKYKYPENGFALFALIRELEQIGDLYKLIAEDFESDDLLIQTYEQIDAYFRLYYDLYYSYDVVKAKLFFSEKERLLGLFVSKEKTIAVVHLTSLVYAVFNLKGLLYLQKI
ncbi:MAG: AbrB/MazE/SpoVT family DNA-binding domain-containing protein [Candidatus Woesearchaeota archaeon]|jgi:phosphate uptake regulator